jgi:lipase
LNQGACLSDIADALSGLSGMIGEPFHLVGHSFGGAVALKIAHVMPDMIRSLTVIEPAAFHLLDRHTLDLNHLTSVRSLASFMRRALARGDADAAMMQFVDFWNGQGAWARTSLGLRQKLAQQTVQVIADFTAIESETATLVDYAAIRCPVLAVTGRNSPLVTQHLTERVAATLAGARLAEILDAGHMVPLTDPHEVDPIIAAHIKAADRSRAEDTQYAMAA